MGPWARLSVVCTLLGETEGGKTRSNKGYEGDGGWGEGRRGNEVRRLINCEGQIEEGAREMIRGSGHGPEEERQEQRN